jgi:galactokinase
MHDTLSYAPGRVELLGNHTDYNEGFVMAGAINYGVTLHGKTLQEPGIKLSSENFPETLETTPDQLHSVDRGTWFSYPAGVAQEFLNRGITLPGFEARFSSTLPVGAGLSSSAALEISTAKFLQHITGADLSDMDLARIGCRAENEFVGMNCGLLDQISSTFGKQDHAVTIDCRTLEIDTIAFPENCALIICDTGVKHELTGGEYNERREQCFSAAGKLGVEFLRDVDRETLEAKNNLLNVYELKRARHVVGENQRVQLGIERLKQGDLAEFGKLMYESHESSRRNFKNSTKELDILVTFARQIKGIYGSRLTGGGFGGATVSLVDQRQSEDAAEKLLNLYNRSTGNQGTIHVCRLSDGAKILEG